MKKYLLILFIIIISIFFTIKYIEHSKYYLGKEYRNEINALLETEILKTMHELDGLLEEIEKEKDPYDKIGLIEMGVDIVFFNFYWKLVDTTEKYIGKDKIINRLPHNDNVWEIHWALIPYFKNNRINTSKIFALIEYGDKKQKEIEKKYANFSYIN